jgi:beta-mannanase
LLPSRAVRRSLLLAFVVVLGVVAAGPSEGATRSIAFGAFSPPAPYGGMDRIDSLESRIGHSVGIVQLYQIWGDSGSSSVNPQWLSAASTGGRRKVLITWEPQVSASRKADQPEYSLSQILSGRYDSYIQSWAQGLAAYGRPVYLRLMHEMNGNWYPWCGTVNGNTPLEFRRAWIHIHSIFHRAGASNVRWVWSPNAQDVPADNDFEKYYPGDRYVDVLALDGYNWGHNYPQYNGGWRSFSEIFGGAYKRIVRLGPQPVWIPETATAPEGDRAAWVTAMFSAVRSSFPRITAIVWFDAVGPPDWQVGSDPAVLSAFRNGLN